MRKNTERKSFDWLDLPDHARPFGGQIVVDQLRDCGHIVNDRLSLGNDSTILVSLYWCEDLYNWVAYRHRHDLKTRKVIIGGNHATGSPHAVAPFCSGVFMGDADTWDGIDSNHIFTAEKPAAPCVVEQLPRKLITMATRGVGKVEFPVMELARGCKYKCHYCQYAWMKPYREQSKEWLIEQISKCKGRVRLSAADIPQHKGYGEIMGACREAGVSVSNQDGALFTVDRLPDGLLGKMQRFGIDGMSERLRRAVKKPIAADWLVERMGEYSSRGVTRCLAYNLFGLPGETREDFLEWDDTIRRIVDAVKAPFTWVNSWNAFLPMPMTPLQHGPSSWNRDARDLHMMAKTREWAKSKGVNVFDMPERTGNATITKRMLAIRGTAATAHIIQTVALRPRINERSILKEFQKCEGYHLHGPMPKDKILNG